ncbi:hypothetical protein ACI7MO_09955 [Bacillus paranthracis]
MIACSPRKEKNMKDNVNTIQAIKSLKSKSILVAMSYLEDVPTFIKPNILNDDVCLLVDKEFILSVLSQNRFTDNGISSISLSIGELMKWSKRLGIVYSDQQTMHQNKRMVKCIGIAFDEGCKYQCKKTNRSGQFLSGIDVDEVNSMYIVIASEL